MTQIIMDYPMREKPARKPLFPPRPVRVEITVTDRKHRLHTMVGNYGHFIDAYAMCAKKGYVLRQYRALD